MLQLHSPIFVYVAAMLAGKPLAIDWADTSKKGTNRREVLGVCTRFLSRLLCGCMLVSLPALRFDAAVATLSSTRILVIGGVNVAEERVNTLLLSIREPLS